MIRFSLLNFNTFSCDDCSEFFVVAEVEKVACCPYCGGENYELYEKRCDVFPKDTQSVASNLDKIRGESDA